jgi:hypothetical protein
MNKPKSYSVLEVLNYSDVGLCFEFYSTKQSGFIVEELEKMISKNIILTNESKFTPTYSNAILLKEYEASRSRYKLFISPENFHAILPIIESVSMWINEKAETTFDTKLKMSLSFNHKYLDTLSSISQMNPSRLILKFDENEVYKRFPSQKNSPYALSIKSISPTGAYINESDIDKNLNYILSTPYAEFYGIDFTDYTRGTLYCNYIGGKNYANNSQTIKDILEYFIIKTYQSINEAELNTFENNEIKRLTEGYDKIQMAFYDPEIFLKEYSNLKVYVDLKTSLQIVKTYWNTIRGPIFEMIINGGLIEGQFNYDTDTGRCQLRKAKLSGTLIKDMDLVSCDLTCIMEDCNLVNCSVFKSRVYNSKFVVGNKINESYLERISVNDKNEIKNSFVINNDEIINCNVINSVIQFAIPGKHIKVDENSTIITKQLPLPKKSNELEVKEIRDYSWIKSMKQTDDLGFQNIYDRNKYLK